MGAAFIEVATHLGIFQSPVIEGAFSANIILLPNRVNPIYFTAVNTCGTRSSPALASITHDAAPPTLFIDFPIDNAELAVDKTDLTGRVGDNLSGFMGLTVEINCTACPSVGINAVVDVGVGTNGTFIAPNVPLSLGMNLISATATDALGNQLTKHLNVNRIEVSPDAPQILAVSGNGQVARVHEFLPEPIVVRILKPDRTPLVNKVVTFNVSRSDGRLLGEIPAGCYGDGTMTLQCHTDANGEVRAMWKMGSDAGNGNNRVEVSTTGILGTVGFCASATPGVPSQINIGSGNNQAVEVNTIAIEQLRVRVSDSCNAAIGLPVTFSVIRGGGKVNGEDSVSVLTSNTGHAVVSFLAGPEPGNQLVQANFQGNPTNPTTFVIRAIARDVDEPTAFSGLVLDNTSKPITGAICTLILAGRPPVSVTTDSQGQFQFPELDSSGPSDFFVDGATATALNGEPVATGSFPFLHFTPIIIPNAKNTLPSPVLLPMLDLCNSVVYDGSQDVHLTIRTNNPSTPGECTSAVEGLKMTVRAGTTITKRDGTRVGPNDPGQVVLALNQVHHDDIPMPMPDGAAPPFAWTLQPGGATFDIPVEIEYPNMSGLPAGAITYFLTFNHDTNRFEVFGTGRVSNDGSIIHSDPGGGLTTAGWGCNCPPYSIEGECELCPESCGGGGTSSTVVGDEQCSVDCNEQVCSECELVGARLGDITTVDLGGFTGLSNFRFESGSDATCDRGRAVVIDSGTDLTTPPGVNFDGKFHFVPHIPQLPAFNTTLRLTAQCGDDPENRIGLAVVVAPLQDNYSNFELIHYVGEATADHIPYNNFIDVLRVQQRLRYLGFPDRDGDQLIVDGTEDNSFFEAIRLFQAATNPVQIPAGSAAIDGDPENTSTGQIEWTGDDTLYWLQATNAPRWIEFQDDGTCPGGLYDISRCDTSSSCAQSCMAQWERFGTSWLKDALDIATDSTSRFMVVNGISENGYSDGWSCPSPCPCSSACGPSGNHACHCGHRSGMDLDTQTEHFC